MRLPGGFGLGGGGGAGGFGQPPVFQPGQRPGFPRAVGPERFAPGIRSFDKLKGKKKIKKSGIYKLKAGEEVKGVKSKRKKGNTHAFVAGRKA